jgi:hypothetical protein
MSRGNDAAAGPSLFRAMEIALEQLVSRWRGQRATVAFDLRRPDVDETRQTFHYEEILDGPLPRRWSRERTRVGTSVISGNIAISGSYISFEPVQPHSPSTTVINEVYVALVVIDLPLVAQGETDTALWEARLANGSASRLRLSTTPSGDASRAARVTLLVKNVTG